MQRVVLLFVTIVWAVSAQIPIDWARVTPVKELDHYWARLPEAWRMLRHASYPKASRITNGQEAIPGQFPYQALVLSEYGALTTMCGGSVLTAHYLITAAHCVMLDQNTLTGGGTGIVGAHNRMEVEPTQQRIRFVRAGVIVHPQYDSSNFRADLAVIRLDTAMAFNDFVQPVRIPGPADNRQFDGFIGTVSGFGRTADSSTAFASILRYTANPVMGNGACVGRWGALLVEPQNVCLSGDDGRSTCNGDSGGPLTVQDAGHSVQIGVTSFGSATGCTSGMPSVYARISFFRDWIGANTDYVES